MYQNWFYVFKLTIKNFTLLYNVGLRAQRINPSRAFEYVGGLSGVLLSSLFRGQVSNPLSFSWMAVTKTK